MVLIGSALGTMLSAVFVAAAFGGIGYAAGMDMVRQIGVHLLAVVILALWCAAATYGILELLQATAGLRVSEEQEREGLDLSRHGERAYNE